MGKSKNQPKISLKEFSTALEKISALGINYRRIAQDLDIQYFRLINMKNGKSMKGRDEVYARLKELYPKEFKWRDEGRDVPPTEHEQILKQFEIIKNQNRSLEIQLREIKEMLST